MSRGRYPSLVLAAAMVLAVVAAAALEPVPGAAHTAVPDLADVVPTRVGDWQAESQPPLLIVNPQQQALLKNIYGQTLNRSYLGPRGERIMLSVAYGGTQSDVLQVHRPEVCYAAQGFQVQALPAARLAVMDASLPVRRLVARQGARHEPITYWIRVGDSVVLSGFRQKLAQLGYGISGQVPDGLLMRVSSIDADAGRAHGLQEQFLRQMLEIMTPEQRQRVVGGLG